jgi:hypothetical protein
LVGWSVGLSVGPSVGRSVGRSVGCDVKQNSAGIIIVVVVCESEGVHRFVFKKHKNIKTYLSRPKIPEKY